jgi:hypothetical protein
MSSEGFVTVGSNTVSPRAHLGFGLFPKALRNVELFVHVPFKLLQLLLKPSADYPLLARAVGRTAEALHVDRHPVQIRPPLLEKRLQPRMLHRDTSGHDGSARQLLVHKFAANLATALDDPRTLLRRQIPEQRPGARDFFQLGDRFLCADQPFSLENAGGSLHLVEFPLDISVVCAIRRLPAIVHGRAAGRGRHIAAWQFDAAAWSTATSAVSVPTCASSLIVLMWILSS